MKKNFLIMMGAALLIVCGIVWTNVNASSSEESSNEISPTQIRVEEYLKNKDYEKKTDLCAIMKNCGSDKATWHNYSTLYAKLFSHLKNEKINVFELGLGTNNVDVPSNMGRFGTPGASLNGWKIYFPNASVYGGDIDKRILFNNDRIKTFYCDQRDEKCIKEMFSNNDLKDVQFDIIIEDGLHQFGANHTFLVNSIDKLKKGGIFIVEDLSKETQDAFRKILPELKAKFSLNYIDIVVLPSPINDYDNSLLVIEK